MAMDIAVDHLTENPKYYSELYISGIADEDVSDILAKYPDNPISSSGVLEESDKNAPSIGFNQMNFYEMLEGKCVAFHPILVGTSQDIMNATYILLHPATRLVKIVVHESLSSFGFVENMVVSFITRHGDMNVHKKDMDNDLMSRVIQDLSDSNLANVRHDDKGVNISRRWL
jgi:hypothetical protein